MDDSMLMCFLFSVLLDPGSHAMSSNELPSESTSYIPPSPYLANTISFHIIWAISSALDNTASIILINISFPALVSPRLDNAMSDGILNVMFVIVLATTLYRPVHNTA
ncbi:hypothetical protein C1H76_2667 [Elsinoe australis]|uniref:Uncharacterized protein n=1 Tax=Elsinoe australis TaxID=40998 RepID=A0A4U7B671_9PEZI|nr:hypothetical protein C1H76_2667 [Elsinoe australis]